MKNAIYLLLFLSIIVSVTAGEIRKIDLEKDDIIEVDIKTKDGIEFDLFDGRHIITADKIHQKGVDLEVFLFVNKGEDQKVSYITVSTKRTLKLDLNKNGEGDLFIGFKKFLSENSARIIFYNPPAEITGDRVGLEDITGEITKEIPTHINNKYIHLFFSIIMIILLLLTICFKIKEKRQNKKD